MAEGIFSIFPDAQAAIGGGLKDGLRMSRKKALRDVKNTLQVKHTAGKPVGKISTANKVGPSCNPPAKDLCASATPKGAFKIKCDDDEDEDHSSWNYCDCEKNLENSFWSIRPPSECFQDEDINYLKRGLLGPIQFDIDVKPCDYFPDYVPSALEIEPYFPPLSPVGPVIYINDE